jgi:hypothetical protein
MELPKPLSVAQAVSGALFGFVSGHDFSRAVTPTKELGFSPCAPFVQDAPCHAGAKAQFFSISYGPTKRRALIQSIAAVIPLALVLCGTAKAHFAAL